MMKSKKRSIKLKYWFLLILIISSCSTQKEPVDYVNPMPGTSSSRWMLFPGSVMPFGMVKLSPDNTDNTKYGLGAGYEFKINSISGFGHVHSWMMGSFLMMPTTGELKILPDTKDAPDTGCRSRINHDNEKASPGYYSVLLDDYGINAGLHPIFVKYFQEGGSNGLEVSWQGPGFEKQEIPADVLFYKA